MRKNSIKLTWRFIVDDREFEQRSLHAGRQVGWMHWTKQWASTLGLTGLTLAKMTTVSPTRSPYLTKHRKHARRQWSSGYDYNSYVSNSSRDVHARPLPALQRCFPARSVANSCRIRRPPPAQTIMPERRHYLRQSGKRGTWEVTMSTSGLAQMPGGRKVVDSDFGAFTQDDHFFPGPTPGAGYTTGTNVKGHILRLAYSPTDL